MNAILLAPRLQRASCFFALCLLTALSACQPETAGSDKPVDQGEVPFGKGLLWKIEKEGLEPSHVFATPRVIDPRLCSPPLMVWQAFGSSPRVAFEIVPTLEGEALMAKATRLPPGRTLEEILGAQLFRRAAAIVSDFGPREDALQQVQPWLLAAMLSRSPAEAAHQSRGVLVLDMWLQHQARRQGKVLINLVEFQELIDRYDEVSEEDQIALVRDLVAEFPQIDTQVEHYFAAYMEADLARLMVEAHDVSRSSDVAAATRLRQRLVEDRSHAMVERMLPLVRAGTTFFSLDAVLLPGEAGILALLEQRGFTVTRLH